jgi:hypothetical protein
MRYTFLAYIFFIIFGINAQVNEEGTLKNQNNNLIGLKYHSIKDSIRNANIPVLELPESYKNKSVPYMVDNSVHPYMREPYQQDGLSCGQASSVGYTYTYEMARLKDVSADTDENMYPSHFAWNWMHGGEGFYGVSYFHTFEMLKMVGTPNVADYGGMSYGGSERWMSGYDLYYNAMHNRISEFYSIPVGTPEGLMVLKHWLNDHLDGSAVGGLANFYACSTGPGATVPAGTPEEGKSLILEWPASANHAMTIVGYNDSVRYDINNDGQYTNDIDITGDGVVDMKDWEIGALKFVNSYGGVPNWGDGGYCYTMYRNLAYTMESGDGSFWSQSCHVMMVKETQEPKLAMKVTLQHTKRATIKVYAGIALDVNAVKPEYIMEFPIFDYQGGQYYMQGGSSVEANKTIEFGLDVTPLLNYIDPGQEAKYFLIVDENDPNAYGSGYLVDFSLMDYNSGVNEIQCTQSNIFIGPDDSLHATITAAIDYDPVLITTSILPPAEIYENYNYQLEASGGTAPYRWSFDLEYDTEKTVESFPLVATTELSLPSGLAEFDLPFEFPFYDSTYSTVYISSAGRILFTDFYYEYPYDKDQDEAIKFKIRRSISPFNCELDLSGTGDGVFYESASDHITFWWVGAMSGDASSNIVTAATLWDNGEIDFYYGNNILSEATYWSSGLSNGDQYNWQKTDISGDEEIQANIKYSFKPHFKPEGMDITEDGIFYGQLQEELEFEEVRFKATDNNMIESSKSFQFGTSGVMVNHTINAEGDEHIENGETVNLDINLINIGDVDVLNATMYLILDDQYINITDNSEYVGDLPAGDTLDFANAFTFEVSDNVPDNYDLNFVVDIIDVSNDTLKGYINLKAYSVSLDVVGYRVEDGNNNMLDPGETGSLYVSVKNVGGGTANNITGILSSLDPNITVILDSDQTNIMAADEVVEFVYEVEVSQDCPYEYAANMNMDLSANSAYTYDELFSVDIGFNVEDFETGDFSKYNWQHGGDEAWIVTNIDPFERIYSAKSGAITHDQTSTLKIDVEVFEAGTVSFWKKTSCEDGDTDDYDYLVFKVDDQEITRWDGMTDWSQFSYIVQPGNHTLEWSYSKDANTTSGEDAAWLDYIKLPPVGDLSPDLVIDPMQIDKYMQPDEQSSDFITITHDGPLDVSYNINTLNTSIIQTNKSIEGTVITFSETEFLAGETLDITLSVTNTSSDSEWLKDIYLTVPAGVNLVTATNFVGGSSDMIFDGSTGEDITVNWHGEDGSGWGVITGGQTATANIIVEFAGDLLEDAVFDYQIDGDIYGAEPHIVYGTESLLNTGALVTWMEITPASGMLNGSETDTIWLDFNTAGLDYGTYTAEVIITDNAANQYIVPVNLYLNNMTSSPGSIEKTMEINTIDTDTLTITNGSASNIYFAVEIPDSTMGPETGWVSPSPMVSMVPSGSESEVYLNFNTNDIGAGTYTCLVNVRDVVTDVISAPGPIPVTLTVENPLALGELSSRIELYPNPAESYVRIVNSVAMEFIEVLSIDGKLIAKINVVSETNSMTLNLKSLASGMYLLKIYNTDGTVSDEKLMISK